MIQLDSGAALDDIDVDMRLSVLKPVCEHV